MADERDHIVLREVVNSHVETAAPVASRTVAERLDIGLSAATIRNTMMDLEQRGFLTQPHASSGRIPTDLGYRTYVDELMEPAEVPDEDLAWIDARFDDTSGDMMSVLSEAARLLGGACHQLGLVLAPSLDGAVLTGLEFVRMSSHRVLVVLKVKDGFVQTVLLDVSANIEPDALAVTALRLNECLVGLTLEEIRRTIAERSREWSFGAEEIVTRLVARGPSLFRIAGNSVLYVGGTTHIVNQPEFQSQETLGHLLDMIEERSSLCEFLKKRSTGLGVQISIGRENPTGPLEAASVVTLGYARGGLTGALGIIGPTRMPYARVAGVLNSMVRHLGSRFDA